MFTIYGGKTEFNQWEQGQMVTNPSMTAGDKVRFWNGSGETHPMIAYKHEGVVVADVPNDLLQRASPILVDLCGKPEYLTRFMVNFVSHKAPDGYCYNDNTHCEPVVPSGGGGVTSWNDLKDKPFGNVEVVWIEEQSIVFGSEAAQVTVPFELSPGVAVTVEWNGTVYHCTTVKMDSFIYFGNLSNVGGDDTGEPFLFAGIATVAMCMALDGAESATVKVVTVSAKKLERKYCESFVVLYLDGGDNAGTYLYKDVGLSQKVIADELHAFCDEAPIIIKTVFLGVAQDGCIYPQMVSGATGTDGVSFGVITSIKGKHCTAEYTPETSE